MPTISVSPNSIVNQIKNLLRDRYASGYPILKELVQNADDAGARRVRLDVLVGWAHADNPLLRVPGLLAVNDGTFRLEDQHGILSFGESVKATDGSAIGKFGLGQKSVFHVCDAFIVHAFGSESPRETHVSFSTVVNPFLGVRVDDNKAGTWEGLSHSDLNLLRAAVPTDCRTSGLLLWLPFRREGLRPAPDAGFSEVQPQPDRVVAELAHRDDLRLLVTTLRHVESIEIRNRGELRCAAHLLAANERLLGPERWRADVRSFSGTVGTEPDGTRARFVGREATLQTERLQRLQDNEHWPRAISALSSTPEHEKGEPHGAATLLRVPQTSESRSTDHLAVSWAVFLPISETETESDRPPTNALEATGPTPRIGLAGHGGSATTGDVGLGQFRLLLHGYFFLDSGRRHIEGLSQPRAADAPSTTAELGRAWNAEVRDAVVLPLIPVVLWDALQQKLIRNAELVPMAASLARHPWFRRHRRAICGEHALVRAIEPPSAVVWRLVPAGSSLRPLPGSVAAAPARLRELFNGVHALARDRNLLPCVDPEASLTAEPTRWLPDELGALFATLSPRVFQLPALARLLGNVLAMADPPLGTDQSDLQETIGPHLRRALCDALNDTDSSLAHSEQIRSILSHAPRAFFLTLPKSVEHRRLLQALASARTSVLPVRHEWLVDVATPGASSVNDDPRLSRTDLAALLRAVEPIIADGEQPDLADQAAACALEFLRRQDLEELSRLEDFADLAILRGRDPGNDEQVVLTLKESCERSRNGLLFRAAPTAKTLLRKLARAVPDVQPVIVSGKTAELLTEQDGSTLRLFSPDKRACLDLVDSASRFENATDRAELIHALQVAEGDHRTALRKLCAGKPGAGIPAARLAATDGLEPELESIAAHYFSGDQSMFLVPRCIADALSRKQREYIGVGTLDNPGIEALFERNPDALLVARLTETERDAILQMEISDNVLVRLPIHVRSDGTVGNAEGVFLESAWPIPALLREHVRTVVLSGCPRARTRQETLIPRWSAWAQVKGALSRPKPHTFRAEILDALARIADDLGSGADAMRLDLLDPELRKTSWLAVDDTPIAPDEVWRLPRPVEDAARSLFSSLDPRPALVTVGCLPVNVRERPGFRYVADRLLPDHRTSLEALAGIVAAVDVAGRLGPAEHWPFDDFIILAEAGADLALPGWRLLAALLLAARDTGADTATFRTSFRQLSENDHERAGQHLDALADLASRNDPTGEAARRAYEHGLKAVADWSDGSRYRVFGCTRVPTADGGWRSGREVVLEDDRGVARTQVLDPDCTSILRMRTVQDARADKTVASASDGSGPSDGSLAPSAATTGEHARAVHPVDLTAIEAESVDRHRRFLEPWRGLVPSDLVIVYLGFIGRYDAMRRYAKEWEADATHDVGTLWRELDQRLDRLLPDPLRDRVNHRRFRISEVGGGRVPAVALSGETFEAWLDESSELLVGNSHKQRNVVTSGEERQRRLLVELHLRRVDPAARAQVEALAIFRRFVETVAVDCLWIGMTDERAALRDILDKASRIDQTTLEETERLLQDLAPGMLAQLKPARGSACQQALQKYQEEESWIHRLYGASDPSGPAELAKSKTALWSDLREADAGDELLAAVRAKIEDLGYSARNVLFELAQNADDAYAQLEAGPDDAGFQVEILPGCSRLRVVHWGRPVNHLGRNADEGRRCGYDRDLVNMLLMNFSDKRPGEDLTGKFGLGFKSVHILSESVGIASGFVALRTHGGFLPVEWSAGSAETNDRNRPDGRKATLVDVPFAADRTAEGEECVRAFRAALTWLPVFARRIRRVEVTGVNPVTVECSSRTLVGADGIDLVTVHGSAEASRALRFDLGDGYSLLLGIDEVGPCAPSDDTPRIWNLAPLAEPVTSGWLLNGPFPVDPGRGRLAGSSEDHRSLFGRLGRSLGTRLLELHDFAAKDWARFAGAVGLDPSEDAAQPRFWSRLFGVLRRDLDDPLARHLHAEGGYRRLAAERPVVPTGLAEPFDELVCATAVTRRASGALTGSGALERVRDWPVLSALKGRVVNPEGADVLRRLGFEGIRPVTLCGLLRDELGADKRIDLERSKRLGEVITPSEIEKPPLDQERDSILNMAKHAEFRAQDDSWRPVGALNSQLAGREDEKRLCEFAPDATLLQQDYHGAAIEFFKVARNRAGYGPQVRHLLEWARHAGDLDRQRAVLRYLVDGHQGPRLADALRHDRPPWMPEDPRDVPPELLPTERPDESRKMLVIRLGGHEQVDVREPVPSEPVPAPAESVLREIHDWWLRVGPSERDQYDQRVYPSGFRPAQLQQEDDRAGWFTMFALACFRSLGWFRDGQHRGFMKLGRNEGWWQQLAESTPPRPSDELQPWVDLLERWSAPTQFGQKFLPWRRTFGELYTFVRWLDAYILLFRKLPSVIRAEGPVSVDDILRPAYSPAFRSLGIEAAPLDSSLRIGVSWLLRELSRHGVYDANDAPLMAPYCWAPTQRIRGFLQELGVDCNDSRGIHDFVENQIGCERARFTGDFDLPLQLHVSRRRPSPS